MCCCICTLPVHKMLEQGNHNGLQLETNKLLGCVASECSDTYSAAVERCWRRGHGA
jgi:ribose 5-phosphate isomerase RpiB